MNAPLPLSVPLAIALAIGPVVLFVIAWRRADARQPAPALTPEPNGTAMLRWATVLGVAMFAFLLWVPVLSMLMLLAFGYGGEIDGEPVSWTLILVSAVLWLALAYPAAFGLLRLARAIHYQSPTAPWVVVWLCGSIGILALVGGVYLAVAPLLGISLVAATLPSRTARALDEARPVPVTT